MKKKIFYIFTFLVLFYLNLALALPTSSNSPQDEWWAYGGNTGFQRFTTANAPATISNTINRTVTLGQDVDNSPIIVGDSLFIIADSLNPDYAYQLNASNISQKLANSTNTYDLTLSPVYYRGSLYFHRDTYLYQINISNLSQSINSVYITDAGYEAVPIVSDGAVYVGDGNYNPYIKQFNASNISQTISSYSTSSRIYGSTPVLNGYAYAGTASNLVLLNASNLAQSFTSVVCNRYDGSENFFSVDNNYVYKGCLVSTTPKIVHTLQLNSSNLSQQIANFSQGSSSWYDGTILGNGFVYFSYGANFYQLNASNISQQIANYTFPSSTTTAPLATPKYIFVGAGTRMYQLNASNVSQYVGNFSAGGTINGAPVVAKGFLYFGATDNKLYQLGVYDPLPAISISYPADGTTYLSASELNYTLIGNVTWDSCWYSNDSGITNYSVQTAGTNFVNLVNSTGWNNWTVYCNDTTGGIYNSLSSFFIDIDTPYFVNVLNQTTTDSAGLSYTISAGDSGGIGCFGVNDTVNFKISCSGLLQNNTLLQVGLYNLNITVNDSAYHQNSTLIWINVTDGTPPIINITFPLNNTNYSVSIDSLNYTASDNIGLSVCWWSNNSGKWNSTTQVSGTNFTSIVSINGWNNWTVYCNDSSRNIGNKNVKFTVDTIAPNITLNSPADSYINNSFGVMNVTFNCSASDNFALQNISLYLTNSSNSNFSLNQTKIVSGINANANWTVGLANGDYTWNCLAFDSLGNSNLSNSNRTITINPDITPPTFNNLRNQTIYQGVALNYQINATDSFGISCFTVNNTNFNINCSGYLKNNTLLDIGLYNLNLSVNDTSNNINYVFMWVNVTAMPRIGLTLISPTRNLNVTQNKTFQVSVNVSCSNANCGEVNVSLDPAGDLVTNGNFETGDLTGWLTYGSANWGAQTTTIKEGTYAAKSGTIGNSVYTAIEQNVTLTSNASLRFWWKVSSENGCDYLGFCVDQSYGVSGCRFNSCGSATGNITSITGTVDWTLKEFNLTAGTHRLLWYYAKDGSVASGSDAGWLDNVTLLGNSGKSGLVSINISAIPFYTTTQNPYDLTLNNGESAVITWTVNATGAINNDYPFFVYANKTSDMSIGNTTSFWNITIVNFSIGIVPPSVSIVYPLNANYSLDVTQLNYTVSGENLSVCWYSLDSGITNSSFVNFGTNFANLISIDGANTWMVYCNGTNNTIGSSSSTFYKDTISPIVTSNSPSESYSATVVTSLNVTFNCSASDNFALQNISLYITNSSNGNFALNKTTIITGTNSITNWTLNLGIGNYTWNCLAFDSLGNSNFSDNRTIWLETNIAPEVALNSPTNNTLLNKKTSILLNATITDANGYLDNFTVWFYGGYSNGTRALINTFFNATNRNAITFNWTLGTSGRYNWTVIANDGKVNSTNYYFYFNLTNFSISCEAGGNYQQGALVLVQGIIKNESTTVPSYIINLSVYDSDNNFNTSQNLTTANDGGFETSFANLSVGNYILNATAIYRSYTEVCTDTFSIGTPASFVLDKIVSINNLTNTTIIYNLTLRVTNKGGSDAISVNLIDSDSVDSPYYLENVSANSGVIRSYMKEYSRTSSTYDTTLATATLNATNSYSGNEIFANSSEIILTIPAAERGQQITLVKNAYYNSENSTRVNYTLSIDVVNSGGIDLNSISLIDNDLNINSNINLNRTQNYNYSGSVLIEKAASNTNKLFAKSSATVNSATYQSNQIQVRIPGYGGPADAIVSAPSSVSSSTSFNTIISVENKNLDIGQDFVINYWITNINEDVNYTSGQQTIYVAASGSSDLTATLNSPSTAGDYRFRALVSWAGGTATAYDSFSVSSSTSTPETSSGSSSGGGSLTGDIVKDSIVCNSPYIRYGKECCLDKNNNSICDLDETFVEEKQIDQTSSIKPESELIEAVSGKKDETSNLLEISNYLSNFYNGISKETKSFLQRNTLLLWLAPSIFILAIFILLAKKFKMNNFMNKLTTKRKSISKNKKINEKDFTKLSSHIGTKVYSSGGDILGDVKEIYFEKDIPKISGWVISLDKKLIKKTGKKFIFVKHNLVVSINDIIIVDKKVLEYLEKFKA